MFVSHIVFVACFLGVLVSAQAALDEDSVNDLVNSIVPALQDKTEDALDTLNSVLVNRRRSLKRRGFWDDAADFANGALTGYLYYGRRDADADAFEDRLKKAEDAVNVLAKASQIARDALDAAKNAAN
ncbi:uncharacterized protein LOC131938692 [Physella acuta]|uniref:uncharacterized protein LOC131938692 n=1 Tax=Physella acuta TaxID=109671 RepID=UPI0027DAEC8B|nr:uncharacterized protein LOC131938692 [Physella acuta]